MKRNNSAEQRRAFFECLSKPQQENNPLLLMTTKSESNQQEKNVKSVQTRFTVVPVYKIPKPEFQKLYEPLVKEDSKTEEIHDENSSASSHSSLIPIEEKQITNSCTAIVPYVEKPLMPVVVIKNKANFPKESGHQETVPSSLLPIVHPRLNQIGGGVRGRRHSQDLRKLVEDMREVPHGATIPALHDFQGNQQVLSKILKESQKSIEFGMTDGRNIKVISSNSSQMGYYIQVYFKLSIHFNLQLFKIS